MTTFAQWFDAQAGRGDAVGIMASAFSQARGSRPKVSGVAGVKRWLLADPDRCPQIPAAEQESVLVSAVTQYHEGSYQQGPAVPAPRLDQPPPPLAAVPGPPQAPDQDVSAQIAGLSPALVAVMQGIQERLGALASSQAAQGELVKAALDALLRTGERLGAMEAQLSLLEPLAALAAEVYTSQVAEAYTPDQGPAEVTEAFLAGQAAEPGALLAEALGQQRLPEPTLDEAVTSLGVTGIHVQPGQPAGLRPLDWAGGLCELHCREDRCMLGCSCPGHLPDGRHVVQSRALAVAWAALQQDEQARPAPDGQRSPPEPDWAALADAGNPGEPPEGSDG